MARLVFSILFSVILISVTLAAFPFDSDVANNDALGTRQDINYRLSSDLYPISYDIFVYPKLHLDDISFDGQVEIKFRAEKALDRIVLHARQLTIKDIDVIDIKNNLNYIGFPELNDTTDFLTITSGHIEPLDLKKGEEYLLRITYSGSLRRDNAGFYLSSYVNGNNETVYLATTQFQTTDARHGFPCFDEPGFKATFNIVIRHGTKYKAISNMPLSALTNNNDGTTTTKFQTTPRMSTYLVAFIVSDFISTESDLDTKRHRVFSREEAKSDQNFALETSKLALKSLEDYLGVRYSLSKIDNVAIPDFAAGAMENWGLVTYREEYVLYNKSKSTTNTQLNVAIMIAHEFAHQWFGDLVTPKWWTHLWMNEGFASLYEYLTVDNIYKDWDVMQIFTVSHFQRALLSDGQKIPRAMTTYVEDPVSIANIFDSVSYAKAACVLRMFQHTLTDAAFKKALNSYLVDKSYGVVEQDDLFEYLTRAAVEANIFGSISYSAKNFFESWTNNGGYPVLTVTRDYSNGMFSIKQEMFDGTNAPTAVRVWVVPYNYVYGNNPNFTSTRADGFLLMTPTATVQKGDGTHGRNDWLLLNKQQTGYYRVNYDSQNWKLLTQALVKDHTKIHKHNRAQLIDDSVRLTFAGRLTPDVPFSLLEYLKKEEDYAPWAAANNIFAAINTYFMGDNDYELYQYFIGELVTPFFKKVGISENANDHFLLKLTRNIAINWACRANVGNCLNATNARLNQVIETGIDIEPNLKVSVFCNGLIQGGEEEFRYIFRRILDSNDQAERRQLMPTLGCSQNEDLLMEFLMTSIAYGVEMNYREQERMNVFSSIVDKNQVGLRVAIRFLSNHSEEYSHIGSDFTKADTLLSALRSIATRVYSNDLYVLFLALLDKLELQGTATPQSLAQIRTLADNNIAWIVKNRKAYISWLNTYKNSAGSMILSTTSIIMAVVVSLRSLL